MITNNQITSRNQQEGINLAGYAVNITGNTLSNCSIAIKGAAQELTVQGNTIVNNQAGVYCSSASDKIDIVISNNLISNNKVGIGIVCPIVTIKSNTITNNEVGISIVRISQSSVPTIENNNIYENSQYSLSLGASNDIKATSNWWGTTDSAVIDQKIYDFNDDVELGKVNYTPFLTAANPNAMPDPNTTIPTPNTTTDPSASPASTSHISVSPSQNPTSTANQPVSGGSDLFGLDWIGVVTVVLLGVIAVLLVFVVVYLRRRSVQRL